MVRNTQTERPLPPKPEVEEPPESDKDPKPEPRAGGDPKTTGPTLPIPPRPPPPPEPKEEKETCGEKIPDRIRCDDSSGKAVKKERATVIY